MGLTCSVERPGLEAAARMDDLRSRFWSVLGCGAAGARSQNLDVSDLAIAGTVGSICTKVHRISPPRYTASIFLREASVQKRITWRNPEMRDQAGRLAHEVPCIVHSCMLPLATSLA